MKKMMMLVMLLGVFCCTEARASDSLAAGIRFGAAVNQSSEFYEAFGDFYLNRLVSIGIEAAYCAVDWRDVSTIRRDESMPVTLLFKVHAPMVPLVTPYAGAGQSIIFHNNRGTKGSQVFLAGADLPLGKTPFFLNMEYRRQFDDKLDLLAGGLGLKF